MLEVQNLSPLGNLSVQLSRETDLTLMFFSIVCSATRPCIHNAFPDVCETWRFSEINNFNPNIILYSRWITSMSGKNMKNNIINDNNNYYYNRFYHESLQ